MFLWSACQNSSWNQFYCPYMVCMSHHLLERFSTFHWIIIWDYTNLTHYSTLICPLIPLIYLNSFSMVSPIPKFQGSFVILGGGPTSKIWGSICKGGQAVMMPQSHVTSLNQSGWPIRAGCDDITRSRDLSWPIREFCCGETGNCTTTT